MKIGCCGLGIFGMIAKAISKVVEVIVAVIVYLGLYWPMFYMIVILFLWLYGGFTFEPSLETNLFYVGLALSLLCSIVLTLRHLIFEPFGRYLDRVEADRAVRAERMRASREKRRRREMEEERRERDRRDREYRKDRYYHDDRRSRYDDRYGDRYESRPRREPRRDERPLVYRSRQDRSLIIYEFSDRFEVYREDSRGLRHIDTRRK